MKYVENRAIGGVHALSLRPLAFVLGALFAVATLLSITTAAGAQTQESTGTLPVTGTLEDGGNFEGEVSDLSSSVGEDGDLEVSGVLDGTATDAEGATTEITDQAFTTTAALEPGEECDILFLDLGPLFLDLLGLQVDLEPIVLDVTAVPGPGNLLGNLLCAVAGLLDNPGEPTNAISNLLDRIFGLL
ncbi:MAG: ABC transporter substrate-binding protein [Rubrobacter sp.]|nr:ABC transporter substrate-binding protein [Rubrobacter sp.]